MSERKLNLNTYLTGPAEWFLELGSKQYIDKFFSNANFGKFYLVNFKILGKQLLLISMNIK